MRPNTLAALRDISQYPFVRHKPISVRETSYDKLFVLDKSCQTPQHWYTGYIPKRALPISAGGRVYESYVD